MPISSSKLKLLTWKPLGILSGLFLLGFGICAGYIFSADRVCPVEQTVSARSPLAHLIGGDADYEHQKRGYTSEGQSGKGRETQGWLGKFFCEAKAADIALVFFTWCLVVVTGWLAWATLMLWRAGENQIAVAGGAAAAAQESAAIAKQALLSLERPFVFVKEISMLPEHAPGYMSARQEYVPGPVTFYRISAVLENSGQTPAVRMTYNFNCGHVGREHIANFAFPDQGSSRNGILGPKATLHTWQHSISGAAMSQIVGNIDRWFIWGWTDYDDIFENTIRHRTEFCFEVEGRTMADGQVFVAFTMHDRFNATDGDCLRKPQPFEP